MKKPDFVVAETSKLLIDEQVVCWPAALLCGCMMVIMLREKIELLANLLTLGCLTDAGKK